MGGRAKALHESSLAETAAEVGLPDWAAARMGGQGLTVR
jgi:hypothetical protein